MPEGRMLKKRISESKKLALLNSDSWRLLYTWLIHSLDIEGRHSADPEIIKGRIFPKCKDWGIKKINNGLKALNNAHLIILFESNGETYLQFTKTLQKLYENRESPSTIPAPENCKIIAPNSCTTHANSCTPQENSSQLNESKVKESKVKGISQMSQKEDTIEKEFSDFWEAYPQDKGDRGEALRAFTALRKKIELESIVKAFNGYMDFLKDKRLKQNFNQNPLYASTFLRKDKWKRFLEYKYKPSL